MPVPSGLTPIVSPLEAVGATPGVTVIVDSTIVGTQLLYWMTLMVGVGVSVVVGSGVVVGV